MLHANATNIIIKDGSDEYIWSESIERILDKMRINCVNLSEYHMFKYRRYKRYLMFFRIPIITPMYFVQLDYRII